MSTQGTAQKPAGQGVQLSGRTIAGLVIAVILVVWIVFNRELVHVSLVFVSVLMPLWAALVIAAVLGAAAGFLLARRRYRQ